MHATIWNAPSVADGATAPTLSGYGANARREPSGQDVEAFAMTNGGGWPMTAYPLRDYLLCPAPFAVDGDRTARLADVTRPARLPDAR